MGLTLLNSNQDIKRAILEQADIKIRQILGANSDVIQSLIAESLRDKLKNTPEYLSMTLSGLKGAFGFEDGTEVARANAVVNAIADAVTIEFPVSTVTTNKIVNVLRVGLVPKEYDYLYQLQEAYIFTEKGDTLPWLEWLLEKGDRIIIDDYKVAFIPEKGRSRMAIMIKSSGAFWKVPAKYSGTKNNNWITRTVMSMEFREDIKQIIATAF